MIPIEKIVIDDPSVISLSRHTIDGNMLKLIESMEPHNYVEMEAKIRETISSYLKKGAITDPHAQMFYGALKSKREEVVGALVGMAAGQSYTPPHHSAQNVYLPDSHEARRQARSLAREIQRERSFFN